MGTAQFRAAESYLVVVPISFSHRREAKMTNSRMYRALFQSAVLTTTVLGCTDQKPTTPQANEPEVVLMSVSDKQPALFKNVAKYSEIGSGMAMSAVQAGDVTLSIRALLGSDGRVTLVVTTGHIDAEDAPG